MNMTMVICRHNTLRPHQAFQTQDHHMSQCCQSSSNRCLFIRSRQDNDKSRDKSALLKVGFEEQVVYIAMIEKGAMAARVVEACFVTILST
jgi:hypothetical protein